MIAMPERVVEITQGQYYSTLWIAYSDSPPVTPWNLTGFTPFLQIRGGPGQTILWDSTAPGVGSSLAVDNDPTTGKILLILSAALTATFPADRSIEFELKVRQNSDHTIVYLFDDGRFVVAPQITVVA